MARMFIIRDAPRTMTKREWKAFDRWLRIEERRAKPRVEGMLLDLAFHGTAGVTRITAGRES